MKKSLALLILVGCASPEQRTFERAMKEGPAYESAGKWAEATDVYERARSSAAKMEKEHEIESREGPAFRNAFADLRAAEERGDSAEMVRIAKLIQTASSRYGERKAVDAILARGEVDVSIQRARDLAKAGDYAAAIQTLQRIREAAKRNGRGEEIDALAAEIFESAMKKADGLAAAGRYREAVDAYQKISSIAADFGRADEVAEKIRGARTSALEEALAKGAELEGAARWSDATTTYEGILGYARELGRAEEVESRLTRTRFEAAFAKAADHESRGRYEDAIRAYESLKTPDREAEQRVSKRVGACRDAYVDQVCASARDLIEDGKWSQALELCRKARAQARLAGREDELSTVEREAQTGRLNELLDQAARARRRDDFDESLRLLKEAGPLADDLRRRKEVDEQVYLVYKDQYDAWIEKGEKLEQAGRYEDAIEQYEAARPLAKDLGCENEIPTKIAKARTNQFESYMAEAQRCEKREDWESAFERYEQCGPVAKILGREKELRRASRWATEMARGGAVYYQDFEVLKTLQLRTEITAAAISSTGRDGQWFATGDSNGRIRVFRMGDFEQVFQHESKAKFTDMAFSPDRRLLAVSDSFTRLRVFNFHTNQKLDDLQHESAVNSCDYSPDGMYLVAGCEDGKVYRWKWRDNKDEGRPAGTYSGHTGAVKVVRYVKDDLVLSASADGTIRLWDTDTGECVRTIQAHEGGCCCMTFDAKLKRILSVGHDDHCVRILNPDDGTVDLEYTGSDEHVASFDSLRRYILTGHASGDLSIRDAKTGELCRTFRNHRSEVTRILPTDDGRLILTTDRAGTVCVWGMRD